MECKKETNQSIGDYVSQILCRPLSLVSSVLWARKAWDKSQGLEGLDDTDDTDDTSVKSQRKCRDFNEVLKLCRFGRNNNYGSFETYHSTRITSTTLPVNWATIPLQLHWAQAEGNSGPVCSGSRTGSGPGYSLALLHRTALNSTEQRCTFAQICTYIHNWHWCNLCSIKTFGDQTCHLKRLCTGVEGLAFPWHTMKRAISRRFLMGTPIKHNRWDTMSSEMSNSFDLKSIG